MIALAITPLYLQYLEAEAYGLVGFFVMMQAWLNLLDVGLTPTLGRQLAYARGQESGLGGVQKLLKSFEIIFIVISVIVVFLILLFSNWISAYWLRPEALSPDTISYCINLMGGMIAFRWFTSLYRSGLNGLEDHVWINIISASVTTLKFLGSLLLLMFVTTDVESFFEFQFIIGFIELLVVRLRFYSQLPVTGNNTDWVSFDKSSVKSVAPFALSIAYTSGLWVLVSQTDKLVLSGIITLREFGYFSLVVLVAGAVNTLSSPISQAVQPRMTYLLSVGKEKEMLQLYRNSTQLVTLIVTSVSLMIAFFSEQLIYAWTGDKEAAEWSKDILFWFALGNGVLSVVAFQYYLQIAYGKLKLHVLGSTLSAVIDVPIIIYAAINYGALGVGISWFVLRVIWFVIWTPIVHKIFAPDLHFKWLFNDVLPIVITISVLVFIAKKCTTIELTGARIDLFLSLLGLGLMVFFLGAISSSLVRNKVAKN